MKRDLELIRSMLLLIEHSDDWLQSPHFLAVCNDYATINYHLSLLASAGFITYKDTSDKTQDNYLVKGMTNAGHDYLDKVRNETIWSKTKEKLGDLTNDVSFTVITRVAEKVTENLLGI